MQILSEVGALCQHHDQQQVSEERDYSSHRFYPSRRDCGQGSTTAPRPQFRILDTGFPYAVLAALELRILSLFLLGLQACSTTSSSAFLAGFSLR